MRSTRTPKPRHKAQRPKPAWRLRRRRACISAIALSQKQRAAIRKRQLRARFLEPSLFADPAWDILLDLTAARAEGRRVSVTSLCIASGVPPTTALRWISLMTDQGLLRREEDMVDRRRAYIGLTDDAVEAMAKYFDAAGSCDCAGV